MMATVFHGFCMALADSVPGVSGGTVAFILGFYERFINALHDLFRGKARERKTALCYLLKLGIGWCLGMALSIILLARLFQAQIYFLSSMFLGLTCAAIPFILLEERPTLKQGGSSGKRRNKNLIFTVLGILLVCGLTLFRASFGSNGVLDYRTLQPLQYGYLFIAGMLAIAAMVLPGISGSTVLLIFGVYLPTIEAVHAFLQFQFSVTPGLLALGLGILAGIAVSIHFIRAALRRRRQQMIYLILGLMLGSLYAIVMGPTTLAAPQAPLCLETFQLPAFFAGIGVLLGLEKIRLLLKRTPKDATPSPSRPAKP